MSEFSIIKCKKCDAGLVELEGEKVTSCVQCGHNFTLQPSNKKSRTTTALGNKNNNKGPVLKSLIEQLKQVSASKPQIESKATKVTPKKKKSNPIGTIIFYIILFNIIRAIFYN